MEEEICLVHQKLQEMPPIQPPCKHAILRRNTIKTVKLLPCPTLLHLDLYDNLISVIVGLENVPNLQILDLSFNLINSNKVPQLLGLKEFYLIGNDILNIEIMDFPLLEKLDLAENEIQKIENLDNLSNLKELYLANNKICVVENLIALNCEIIDLQFNKIEHVDCMELPKNVEVLLLSGNTELKSIVNINQLPRLNFLAIKNTQVDRTNIRSVYKGELWEDQF